MDKSQALWHVYQMPHGDWAAMALGMVTDGFESESQALRWVAGQLSSHIFSIPNWDQVD